MICWNQYFLAKLRVSDAESYKVYYLSEDSNLMMGLQSFTPMDQNNDTVTSECIAANENDDAREAELRWIGQLLIETYCN